jgi:chromosome partitioning protein
MPFVVAVVNNKGGVGKSTVTANLSHAYALANKGKRVLAVDLDSQCNLTELMTAQGTIGPSLYELLDDSTTDVHSCIYPTPYEGVSAIPNIPETASLELKLMNHKDNGWHILRTRLREYALSNYDLTIMDCPPNLGLFVLQAMVAADFVLVAGTSAQVWPPIAIALHAQQTGAFMVDVNPDTTDVSVKADAHLAGPAGEVLPALWDRARSKQ